MNLGRKVRRDMMRKKMEVARKKEIKEAAEGNVSGEKGKVNPKQSKLKKLGLALRLNLIKSYPKYR